MDNGAERRRFPRYEVARLPGVLDGFRLFETVKLSIGGALIRIPAELALEERVQVSFEIDDATFRSAAYVVFAGPDLGTEGLYRIGLAFADTAEEDRNRLQRFIEQAVAAGELR
jgi:hypothetical protein